MQLDSLLHSCIYVPKESQCALVSCVFVIDRTAIFCYLGKMEFITLEASSNSMCGEALVNEIHCHPGGCLMVLVEAITSWYRRLLRLGVDTNMWVYCTSYFVMVHPLGGAGRLGRGRGECGPLPCVGTVPPSLLWSTPLGGTG